MALVLVEETQLAMFEIASVCGSVSICPCTSFDMTCFCYYLLLKVDLPSSLISNSTYTVQQTAKLLTCTDTCCEFTALNLLLLD